MCSISRVQTNLQNTLSDGVRGCAFVIITPLQTYLAHLQFTEAQQETSKAWLLEESIATASP